MAACRGFGGGPPLYTPEPGAKDMKAVLYSWLWHMGMLRGQAENELIGTLDWHGEGTIQVDGQPCTTTKLRLQVNYQTPGYRTQIECKRANGQTYSNVEVMSGAYAWDEDRPGAELVAGEGKATAKPATLDERRIRLWASPQGAPKVALAAAAGVSLADAFVQNPAGLLDRQAAAVFSQRFAFVTQAQHMHRVATVEQGGDLTLQPGVPEVVASNHAHPSHAISPMSHHVVLIAWANLIPLAGRRSRIRPAPSRA